MSEITSGPMNLAIARARERLRKSTKAQLQSYGLNRYRLAEKQPTIAIVVEHTATKDDASTEESASSK